MGDIADAMISGELCAMCGVYLEKGEIIYVQGTNKKMIKTKSPVGVPCLCEDCKEEENN